MRIRKRINKLKISILLIVVIITITITAFGRYIYNNIREAYFQAEQFYFSSDILTVNGSNYKYTNWGGLSVYEIQFELRSYVNQMIKLDYDLNYTVTCTTTDTDKIKIRNKFIWR